MILHFIALIWYIFLFIFLGVRGTLYVIKIWKECDTPSKIFQVAVNMFAYFSVGFMMYIDDKMYELYHYIVG